MEARDYPRHRLSAVFGDLPGDKLQALRADVGAHGLRDARITLLDGQILDGWHRLQVAIEQGIGVDYADFPPDGDAVAFVLSQNAHRRHQDKGTLATIAVRLYGERLPGRGESAKIADMTNPELALKIGVSVRYIEMARRVVRAGTDADVVGGIISLAEADRALAPTPNEPLAAPDVLSHQAASATVTQGPDGGPDAAPMLDAAPEPDAAPDVQLDTPDTGARLPPAPPESAPAARNGTQPEPPIVDHHTPAENGAPAAVDHLDHPALEIERLESEIRFLRGLTPESDDKLGEFKRQQVNIKT